MLTQSHHQKNIKHLNKTIAPKLLFEFRTSKVHSKLLFQIFIKTEKFRFKLSLCSFVSSFWRFVAQLVYWYYFECNSSVKTNMVSTCRKIHLNRRLLNQLDVFDQDIIFGNAAIDRQQNIVFNEGTVDQEFIVNNTGSNLTTNDNLVNVQTLKRCFNERIDSEMGKIVDTVKYRIQNAILTAFDSNTTPRIELAVSLKNESCVRVATSVTANSERGECRVITALLLLQMYPKGILPHMWWIQIMRLKKTFGRGKLIVGPRNTFWPTTTHSSQQCISDASPLNWGWFEDLSQGVSWFLKSSSRDSPGTFIVWTSVFELNLNWFNSDKAKKILCFTPLNFS